LLSLLWFACAVELPEPSGPEATAPVSVAAPPLTPREREALERAQGAAKARGETLKARVVEAMAEGPAAAAAACADEARALTAQVAAARGASVGRSSLRLRNPENAGPAWVMAWLEATGERPAEGVEGFSRVEWTDGAPVARALAPIPVEGGCVICHGDPSGIPQSVKAALAKRYPQDAATGYRPGDLRGAIWAEVRF